MMKHLCKVISLSVSVMALLACLLWLPTEAHAAEIVDSGICGDNLTWVLTDDGVLTISGTGKMEDYSEETAPWYYYRNVIESVILEDGITGIGNNAFRYINNIRVITIPDSVVSIGDYAFYYCTDLISVTGMGGVTTIGYYAFSDCTGMNSIAIPASVTSIYYGAFKNCTSLTDVYVTDIASWLKISYDRYYCKPLSVNTLDKRLYLNGELVTELVIPDGVTTVDNSAFSYCASLTDVTFPNSVTNIDGSAFKGCTGLTSIILPDSVTNIGNAAFDGCTGLTSVTIPTGVISIGDGAFRGCTNLTNVTIPDSVTSLGNYVFNSCSGLTSITIPDSVTTIGQGVFLSCNKIWHVLYTGSEFRWKILGFDTYNNSLDTATIHYNCAGDEVTDPVNKVCTICLANCEHIWDEGTVVQEPTCTEEGTMLYTCSVCGGSKTEAIATIDHTPGEEVEEIITAPTCEASGSYDTVVSCTLCGAELSRTGHTSNPLGHDWDDEVITTEPGCETEGIRTYTCRNDPSHTYADPVPAAGHTPADPVKENVAEDGAYDEVIYCSVCEAEISRRYVPAYTMGDINEDGEADVMDANLAISYYYGNVELSENQLLAADVNGDGEIDVMDANLIISYYYGNIDQFPTAKTALAARRELCVCEPRALHSERFRRLLMRRACDR